jgi:hypothetical protein
MVAKYQETVNNIYTPGNQSSWSKTITHNLNTIHVGVQVRSGSWVKPDFFYIDYGNCYRGKSIVINNANSLTVTWYHDGNTGYYSNNVLVYSLE